METTKKASDKKLKRRFLSSAEWKVYQILSKVDTSLTVEQIAKLTGLREMQVHLSILLLQYKKLVAEVQKGMRTYYTNVVGRSVQA